MSESVDQKAAEDLVGTLRDGAKGYETAAERLRNENGPVAEQLSSIAAERERFAESIVALGDKYGDDVDEDGSAMASLHRTWMGIKDKVTRVETAPVLASCARGDQHAVEVYDDVLSRDISQGWRPMVQRQRDAIAEDLREMEAMEAQNA